MRFEHLHEWLAWQETLHSQKIELGLERIAEVAAVLDLMRPEHKSIVVAGTNGKGSVVSILESIYHQAGYRVGSYTSPHLLRYNERIKIMREDIDDESLCHAFNLVDQARGEISLSYFEFGTLAAMQIFSKMDLDVAIYEVGLGGRLDAVNILDADLAFVTNIGIDHVQWLGNTRESIGLEKAGIFRAQQIAVCGDHDPPESLLKHAKKLDTKLHLVNKDFSFKKQNSEAWSFHASSLDWYDLPVPNLYGEMQLTNAATALMGVSSIDEMLPVTRDCIDIGLSNINLLGRFQRIQGEQEIILDVAHNLGSAKVLLKNLQALKPVTKTYAVFAVLADKDVNGIVNLVKSEIDEWFISQLNSERAMKREALYQELKNQAAESIVHTFSSISEAYLTAKNQADGSTRIVVFGSFLTVSEVLSLEVC